MQTQTRSKSQEALTEFIGFTKYGRHDDSKNRRENYKEIVLRNLNMHLKKFPDWALEIEEAYDLVYDQQVLPSMRSMQFAGTPMDMAPNRMFNCAFANIDRVSVFADIMFLLLGGTGVGYSVQERHIDKLPIIKKPKGKARRFLVGDSVEGWSTAIKALFKSYYGYSKRPINFDLSDIRPKGTRLVVSGGKAPGPDKFQAALTEIRRVLDEASVTGKLRPVQAYDIICHMAETIRAGGIRRAATIALFTPTDEEMLLAKTGQWLDENPQRQMSNNSAVLLRPTEDTTADEKAALRLQLQTVLQMARRGYGEPGVLWVDDLDHGTNPCSEIGLRSHQMCNLTEVNVSDVYTQPELERRVQAAALLGTLQATFTDFHFLDPKWQETCEEDALLGVSMTGICMAGVMDLDLEKAARVARETNAVWADRLGINPAARVTCVKPSGTASQLLGGVSPGIHNTFAPYFMRRCMLPKDDVVYHHLKRTFPECLREHVKHPDTAFVEFPMKADPGADFADDCATVLERIKRVTNEWVKPGYRSGKTSHNVSCTVYVKDDEWDYLADWMWGNRDSYNGIAVLPKTGVKYPVMMYEEITEDEYQLAESRFGKFDLSGIIEYDDNTNLQGELACAGGKCEI